MAEKTQLPTGRNAKPSFNALLLTASLIGTFGGFVAYLYATVLHFMLGLTWDHALPLASQLLAQIGLPGDALSLLAVTTFGGLLVGLCLKRFGVPGEIAAVVNNIHLEDGKIPTKQTPSMIVTSLVSITAGGSAGPEAPLVQIIGSAGSWLGDRLDWMRAHTRTLTFCGMSAALGAFFGAPLAGAVFALEIPHRNGLEYYEALVPSIVSAFFSYWIFNTLADHPHPLFPLKWETPHIDSELLLKSILLGAVGALAAILFMQLFRLAHLVLERLEKRRALLGACGGLLLGLLAIASPSQLSSSTLFWGEFQMREILLQLGAAELNSSWFAPLAAIAFLKMLAVSVTLNSGFRGGFIFPLFFIGGTAGAALSIATAGWLPLPLSIVCLMAAANVGVTRTPISTTILLGTLTSLSLTPLVLAASLTAFVLTNKIQLIHSQRPRKTPSGYVWRET
ncbi:chloride channel protein [Pelagicoccus sp. SDUM812005]|uniref:chloride channel protein n=1 Tax=Pelagicoccus sp. SDUM812005 TaxID=3041257 RepID=UPI00280D0D7A|nr:chloride channel protein [Pelagicoccus sp. SDUM812005]MDQ8182237.1 chloride channel protein [Pelagicoccus sp. SDUM812005]